MKRIFTLVFSLLIMAISFAADYTATQAGNWTDAATWGGAGVPGATDNVNTAGFEITISADAACANLTYANSNAQLAIGDGITLTVNGVINSSTALVSGSNPFSTMHANGIVKLTGAALGTNDIDLIMDQAINATTSNSTGIKINNLIIQGSNPAKTYRFAQSNRNYIHGSGFFKISSGTKLDIKSVMQLGSLSTNELIIEEGAVVSSTQHFKGGAGNNTRINKVTINGSVTCGDFSQLISKDLVIGTNGYLKTSNSSQSNAAVLAWDNWWGAKALSSTPVVTDFGTPTTILMGTSSKIEYGKSGNQNINGIVPVNGTAPATSYSVPFANLKISGSGTKTIQSNLTATGSLVVNTGCTLAVASGVTATFGGMLVNLGTIPVSGVTVTSYTINGSVNDPLMGKIDGSVSGTSVTLAATPLAGYQFVNWTEGGSEVSNSTTYTFTPSGNKTLVANFSVSTGLKNSDNESIVSVKGHEVLLTKIINSLEVYTLNGQLVKNLNNVINFTIDGRGVYVLKMNTISGIMVQKVIVN